MPEQLVLLDGDESDFRLDEPTRELGKKGIAEVRRILAKVVRSAEERGAAA